MKKYIPIPLLLLAFVNLNAQNVTRYLENNLFKINVLSPGITYEMALSGNTTLSSDLNISIGFSSNNNTGNHLLATPYLREQYRYYYNIENRNSKDKNIKNNSANFIALNGSYYLKPIGNSEYVSVYDGFTVAPIWGLQRTYVSGLNIGLIAGPGYNFGTNERTAGFVPIINFTLGWVIGK
jgi:hypothetical protein